MTFAQLSYEFQDGYVDNWLVAGPQAIAVPDLSAVSGDDLNLNVIHQFHQKSSGITKDPVERGPLSEGLFTIGSYQGSWSYLRCQEDHFVDHSGCYDQLHYLRSWAYTGLVTAEAVEVGLVLTTNGPADLWLNGRHIHHHEHFHAPHPASVLIQASFTGGLNKILIRFENVSANECANRMALRVCQVSASNPPGQLQPIAGVHIEIPTLILAIDRRNELEESYETVYMRRDVFTAEDKIEICWPEDLERKTFCDVRLQALDGTTYAQAEVDGRPGDALFLGFPGTLKNGKYEAFVMPRGWEYYERNTRIDKRLSFWVVGSNPFSISPERTYQDRCQEALLHAVSVEGALYAELAKMALKQADSVSPGTAKNAIARVNARTADSPLLLAGLLRMQLGFSSQPKFIRGMKDELQDCMLGYRYGDPGPGSGEMAFELEGDQILIPACEILAGQKYPEMQFRRSQQNGRWHRKHGEDASLAWLEKCCAQGFSDWNSDPSIEKELVALALLADFAADDRIGSLAIVAIDKIFFALALNSYHGVLASSQGRTNSDAIRGGYLQATSGISRMMWGLGLFNQHIAGLVSLALSKEYQLPEVIAAIARSAPEALWSWEKHAVDSRMAKRVANLNAYRTPDGILASAQDYYPGEAGAAEHIWQAVLGPGATVFVNHPANSSLENSVQPNFWLGNKILPRVGQWKDTLAAVYRLPSGDWMGFTHAYFPTFAFDEFALRDGWAFARKGNGYLAITAAGGINLTRQGKHAMRELRSPGAENTWLCLMGRAALDQDFVSFQEKVVRLQPTLNRSSVRLISLRGEEISFGWQEHLRVNGEVLPLESKRHYDSLFGEADFPANGLEIHYGEDLLRLDFGSPDKGGDVS